MLGLGAATALVAPGCLKQSFQADSEEAPPPSGTRPIRKGQMTYRANPRDGQKVSLLGFGCMRLPTLPSEHEGADPAIDQKTLDGLVDTAMEYGVNYYDTAPVYMKGRSEEAMGRSLSRYQRDKYLLATKLSNFDDSAMSLAAGQKMFADSLRYLRTSYVDYLLLHSVGGRGGMPTFRRRYLDNGLLDWLKQQQQEGRIRNLGFSYHGDVKVFDLLMHMHDRGEWHCDFCQIQLNYIDWEHASELDPDNQPASYLYTECHRRRIPMIIMEPLLGGRLANVPRHVAKEMMRRRPQDSAAAWAFRYAGTPGDVLTVLSGMTYMEHLRDNLATFSPLEPVTKEENDFLLKAAIDMAAMPLVKCTGCQYCMPCPWGVDIPGTFAHYNKCVNADMVKTQPNDPGYAEARRAFLIGYDRSVPRLRQADRCVECGKCVKACPQEIPIIDELHRIASWRDTLREM